MLETKKRNRLPHSGGKRLHVPCLAASGIVEPNSREALEAQRFGERLIRDFIVWKHIQARRQEGRVGGGQ